MNVDTALEIVGLGLVLAKNQTSGPLQQGTLAAETLIQIIQKAVQEYERQTGEPLDPRLIQPEKPV
jgi:hypothetical protein